MVWVYAAVALLWIGGAVTLTVGAIIVHQTQVDSGGNLLVLTGTERAAAWWNVVQKVFFPLLALCWLASLTGQVLSYRRSSGVRRQQEKWLAGGAAAVLAGAVLDLTLSGRHGIIGPVGSVAGVAAMLAFPGLPRPCLAAPYPRPC